MHDILDGWLAELLVLDLLSAFVLSSLDLGAFDVVLKDAVLLLEPLALVAMLLAEQQLPVRILLRLLLDEVLVPDSDGIDRPAFLGLPRWNAPGVVAVLHV